MTQLLEQAFEQVASLSEPQQNAFAEWIMAELEAEARWDRSLGQSQHLLSSLAEEALSAYRAKTTQSIDLDRFPCRA